MLDTEPFQRLRYIRQLGHAFLVYPSANHTRFEHALGTYHLASRALELLETRGELSAIDRSDATAIKMAALLHDIGHYPFSHALEEAGLPSHEEMATMRFQHPDLAAVLERVGGKTLVPQLAQIIAGTCVMPLAGLISGSLDLDKIEYLTRDARMAGVPYGSVDVDRLLHSVTLVEQPSGLRSVGISEKGVSALESLLFARYQMYRNVYWHHAVRSATAMFKRLVRTALREGVTTTTWIASATDDTLMELLSRTDTTHLAERLRARKLFKRILEVPGSALGEGVGTWMQTDPQLLEAVENQLATELDQCEGNILLDLPSKPGLMDVDLPLQTDHGSVVNLGDKTNDYGLSLLGVSQALYDKARHLRVFAPTAIEIDLPKIVALANAHPDTVRETLRSGTGLLT